MAPKNHNQTKGYRLDDELLLLCTPKCEMNGCGSKGISRYVPERIMLVDFGIACQIHDASYYWIKSFWNGEISRDELPKAATWVACMASREHARFVADMVFHNNLRLINKIKSKSKLSYYLRIPILKLYYTSVRKFGNLAIK